MSSAVGAMEAAACCNTAARADMAGEEGRGKQAGHMHDAYHMSERVDRRYGDSWAVSETRCSGRQLGNSVSERASLWCAVSLSQCE
jgi:hypothetical protein